MGNRIHALAQQLTGKATIEECSVDELKHIAKRFPYYAPAQFLLLQKLKQIGSPEAEAQNRKAVLFYHDPLLFEYFISSEKFYSDEETLFKTETSVVKEVSADPTFRVEEEDRPAASTELEKENDSAEEAVVDKETPAHILEDFENEFQNQPGVETMPDGSMAPVLNGDEKLNLVSESDNVDAAPIVAVNEETITKDATIEITPPTPAIASELTFEPFHTVDYFASQGIKISQEELPKDKLGKQLKSFTEWLKTMKRIPAAEIAKDVESPAEKKVETMADRSITGSEILTEAMAEVWAKQGNTEKAIETYNKLSLLNPSKTAYFAAKIENLKQP